MRHLWSVNRMTPGWKDEGVGDRLHPVSFHMGSQVNMSWNGWSMEMRREDTRAAMLSHRLGPWDAEEQGV